MPSDFFVNQAEYNLIYQSNPEIIERFSAVGLARYAQYDADNMTYPYQSLYDAPDAPQWETIVSNRFFDVSWKFFEFPSIGVEGIAFRDLETWVIIEGVWEGFTVKEWLDVYCEGQQISLPFGIITRTVIEDNWLTEQNVTLNIQGNYISADIILSGDPTILEGYDAEELIYSINYEIDFDAMKPDAWSLIAQLITFQNPDFGLPDELNVITYGFSLAIWVVVAIIAYTIITKLIPTISGGVEG